MDDAQQLQVSKIFILWQLLGQLEVLMSTALRHHHDGSHLFHFWIVGWRYSINIPSYLDPQITDGDELLEDILWQHICVAHLKIKDAHVVRDVCVDVISSHMQACSGDGSDPPVSSAHELLLLIWTGHHCDDLLSMDVGGFDGLSCDVLSVEIFVNLSRFFLLHGGRLHLHT